MAGRREGSPRGSSEVVCFLPGMARPASVLVKVALLVQPLGYRFNRIDLGYHLAIDAGECSDPIGPASDQYVMLVDLAYI